MHVGISLMEKMNGLNAGTPGLHVGISLIETMNGLDAGTPLIIHVFYDYLIGRRF